MCYTNRDIDREEDTIDPLDVSNRLLDYSQKQQIDHGVLRRSRIIQGLNMNIYLTIFQTLPQVRALSWDRFVFPLNWRPVICILVNLLSSTCSMRHSSFLPSTFSGYVLQAHTEMAPGSPQAVDCQGSFFFIDQCSETLLDCRIMGKD